MFAAVLMTACSGGGLDSGTPDSDSRPDYAIDLIEAYCEERSGSLVDLWYASASAEPLLSLEDELYFVVDGHFEWELGLNPDKALYEAIALEGDVDTTCDDVEPGTVAELQLRRPRYSIVEVVAEVQLD